MKRTLIALAAVIAMFSLAASAGSISGKVSGVTGESVVYVDVIAGKTFPAPTDKPLIDQKGLMFTPHIVAIEQGTTVEFLNSDTVAHNVFWISVGGNKKARPQPGHLAEGREARFQVRQSRRDSIALQRSPGNVGIHRGLARLRISSITDKSGSYKIDNVPDGSYTVTAWHEGAKNHSKPVTVAGEGKADFTLTK